MTQINLFLAFADDSNLDTVATELENRVNQIDNVDEVEALPLEPGEVRSYIPDPETVIQAIGVTVVLLKSGKEAVKGSREVVEEVRKFIVEFRGLVADLGLDKMNLKNVFVDIGNERIALNQLSEQHILDLAR
jgi:hypothetical protein